VLHSGALYRVGMVKRSEMVDIAELAEMAGIVPSTLREKMARGYAPQPDGYVGRTPYWKRRTAEQWVRTRPGRGPHPEGCTCKVHTRGPRKPKAKEADAT
jgi:hypothetical protein